MPNLLYFQSFHTQFGKSLSLNNQASFLLFFFVLDFIFIHNVFFLYMNLCYKNDKIFSTSTKSF